MGSCKECKYSSWDHDDLDQGRIWFVDSCTYTKGNCPNAVLWDKINKTLREEDVIVDSSQSFEHSECVVLKFSFPHYNKMILFKEPYDAESFVDQLTSVVQKINIESEIEHFLQESYRAYDEIKEEDLREEIENAVEVLQRICEKLNKYEEEADDPSFDGYQIIDYGV